MKTLKLLLVLIIIGIIGCGENESSKIKDKDVVKVKYIELNKKLINKEIKSSGKFTTDDETYLSFKIGGIIQKIFVKEGDKVKKGELLAILNTGEIDAMVQQAKLGYEKAKRDFERVGRLYKDSVATLEQLENAKTGFDLSSKQLSIAEFNRNYSEIRALKDGYILKRFVTEGQIVDVGMPILQTNGAGKGDWFLRTSISDKDWALSEINDIANIEIDAYPNKIIKGYIFRKSEGIDPYSGTFSIDIKLTGEYDIKPASGLFGKATIFTSKKVESWVVPFDALLDSDGNNGYVFITNEGKTAQMKKVNIVDFTKECVLIDAGLENSKYLIVSGNAYLKDNSKIELAK